MGSGSWSSSTYKAFADSYTKKSREEIFHQRSLHEEMDLTKSKTHIRESRDSEEHPESLPVFIALDETGSMGSIPDKMIRDYLPKLMDSIIDSIGVKHPQILFMGVGDHECDYYPCQVGQFESSTVAINQCLSKIYLEGRGGGNSGESYLLPWIIAGNHTSIDSWEKRKQKGFLFTVGDAREAAKDQVNLIEKEIRQIKSKIMNLEDLSIKSTESLVVGTDFKADEWVTQMFKLRDDLRNAEICLEIAQNIYNEYFTELPEVGCDKKAE